MRAVLKGNFASSLLKGIRSINKYQPSAISIRVLSSISSISLSKALGIYNSLSKNFFSFLVMQTTFIQPFFSCVSVLSNPF